ncbi:MAG: PEP-CTERM sorting domain-containing protein [Phycisphaerae bacterium]|jgi:hypothetical protein
MHSLRRSARIAVWSLTVSATLLSASTARAAWLPEAGAQIVRIEAQSGENRGSAEWTFGVQDPIDGIWQWALPATGGLTIKDGTLELAQITDLALTIDTDPAVSLNFSVTANNTDTIFTITTAVLGFPTINNGQAFATAAITVTDNNGNGALLTGLQPGNKAYQARYNAGPMLVWADLVDPVSAAADASQTGSERKPSPSGRLVIPGPVSSMQTEFKFKLSAFDQASGTSRFDIIPEPATLVLLAAGGLGLLRRRTR